ncbi:unnamed protein product [Symbiodinium microadriaticum]|nr:unnamed protein product [Symbiodinium microadriaticum]
MRVQREKQDKCDKFEKGLGTVLRNAWSHVEAVQTTDVQALVNHIGDVLEFANDDPTFVEDLYAEEDLAQRQEVVVFHYIVGIMKQLDNLHEDRVMPLLRDRHVFMNGVRFLHAHHGKLQRASQLLIIEALTLMADSEDFSTFRDAYVQDTNDALDLQGLGDDVLSEFRKDIAQKRQMRPLLDLIMQLKRKYHLK